MSPYVVTTKRGLPDTTDPMARLEASLEAPQRRAAATLKEARAIAADVVRPRLEDNTDPRIVAIANTDESGGTVGPLPDGTVVDVEVIAFSRLYDMAEMTGLATPDEVIAAFNAQEATR